MAENDYVRGEMDVSGQETTYSAVMGIGARHGVGLCLGAALFFTLLLRDSGLLVAFIGAFIVYVACYWIVRLFFTH